MDNTINAITLIDDINDCDFDELLIDIQSKLETNDGGLASIFFSGKEETWRNSSIAERTYIMHEYLELECGLN